MQKMGHGTYKLVKRRKVYKRNKGKTKPNNKLLLPFMHVSLIKKSNLLYNLIGFFFHSKLLLKKLYIYHIAYILG
jgi:hypothetical protein